MVESIDGFVVLESYRKTIGSAVWHFCSNCTMWPADDYIASLSPEQIGGEVLCSECLARHDIGDCDSVVGVVSLRRCPVIHGGKPCGRDLRPQSTGGVYVCSAGHRVLTVPPRRSED